MWVAYLWRLDQIKRKIAQMKNKHKETLQIEKATPEPTTNIS